MAPPKKFQRLNPSDPNSNRLHAFFGQPIPGPPSPPRVSASLQRRILPAAPINALSVRSKRSRSQLSDEEADDEISKGTLTRMRRSSTQTIDLSHDSDYTQTSIMSKASKTSSSTFNALDSALHSSEAFPKGEFGADKVLDFVLNDLSQIRELSHASTPVEEVANSVNTFMNTFVDRNSQPTVGERPIARVPTSHQSELHHDQKDLQAIIAVSRLSNPVYDEKRLSKLSDRNSDLCEFATNIHLAEHKCDCSPAEYDFTLNGLSSNNLGDDSKDGHIIRPMKTLLNSFSTSDRREIILIFSTADGFFTNVEGFTAFFSRYASLNLTYIVFDGGSSCRKFTVTEILAAITDTRANGPGTSAAHMLVREFSAIAVAKLVYSIGQLAMRQVIPVTRNKTEIDLDSTFRLSSNKFKPYSNMVRWHQVRDCGQDWFDATAVPRYALVESSSGFHCPVKGCVATVSGKNEMIAHLMGHVSRNMCPLCPRLTCMLGYVHTIDCIRHMEIHISPLLSSAAKTACHECPYCFNLFKDRTYVINHMDTFHLQPKKMLDFAVQARTTTAQERTAQAVSLSATQTAMAQMALDRLPDILRNVTYDPPSSLPAVTTMTVQELKVWEDILQEAKYPAPNYRRTSVLQSSEVRLEADGNMQCPMPGCDNGFKLARMLAEHIYDHLDSNNDCLWCTPEKQATWRRKSSHNQIIHIMRHLPATIPCPKCTYIARVECDLVLHDQKIHKNQNQSL